MSDELIDRAWAAVPGPTEPAARARVLAALEGLRAAIGAYWDSEGYTPVFLMERIAAPIPPAALAGARLLADREAIIPELPRGGVGIEIGTETGAFAAKLLRGAAPREMHIVDLTWDKFDHVPFEAEGLSCRPVLHTGFSWDVVSRFPDETFDWMYVDATHAYADVTRDIAACRDKLRPGGWLVFNDYTPWSPFEAVPYGVMQAVHELLRDDPRFSVACLALHRLGYHDIALRRAHGAA